MTFEMAKKKNKEVQVDVTIPPPIKQIKYNPIWKS